MIDDSDLKCGADRPSAPQSEKEAFLRYLSHLGKVISWCLIATLVALSVGTALIEGRRSLGTVLTPLFLCAIPALALTCLRSVGERGRRERDDEVQLPVRRRA